jgi:beta-lactamase regulating signal transducer with metallopeptidase domain
MTAAALAAQFISRWVTHWLGASVLFGTAIAVVSALLTTTILRRARPALLAAVWTIVLAKFAIPWGPVVPGVVGRLWTETGNHVAEAIAPAQLPAATVVAGASTPASPTTTDSIRHLLADFFAQAPVPPTTTASQPVVSGAIGGAPLWPTLLAAVYLGLVLFLAGRHLARLHRLRRKVRGFPLADEVVQQAVADMARRVGLGRVPIVRTTDEAVSPFVTGCFSPVLVLPVGVFASPAERDAVVAHELAHLRRRDPWVQALQAGVRCLFAFWPVVAWASRRLDRAREEACDAWAVARGPLGREAYARLLVDLARRVRPADRALPALALLATSGSLERRIDMLLARSTNPRLGWTLAGLAGFATLAVLTTRAPAGSTASTPIDAQIEAKVADAESVWQKSCPLDLALGQACVKTSVLTRTADQCGTETFLHTVVVPRNAADAGAAQSEFADALALAKGVTEDSLTPGSDRDQRWATLQASVTEARFFSSEPAFEKYLGDINAFPTGLDMDPDHKAAYAASTKAYQDWLTSVEGQATTLKDAYSEVVLAKFAPWSLHALERIQSLYDAYAGSLEHATAPALPDKYVGVVDPADWRKHYCDAVSDVAVQPRQNATDIGDQIKKMTATP